MSGKYTRADLLDLIEELVAQGAWVDPDTGNLDHLFMSVYEEAIDVLVTERPHRWEATPTGARLIRPAP